MATLPISELKARLAGELHDLLRLEAGERGPSCAEDLIPGASASRIAAFARAREIRRREERAALIRTALQTGLIDELSDSLFRAAVLDPGDERLVAVLARLQSAYRLALRNRRRSGGVGASDWREISGVSGELRAIESAEVSDRTLPDLRSALALRRYRDVPPQSLATMPPSGRSALDEAQAARDGFTRALEQAHGQLNADQWSGADVYLTQAITLVRRERECAEKAWALRAPARMAATANGPAARVVAPETPGSSANPSFEHFSALETRLDTCLLRVRSARWSGEDAAVPTAPAPIALQSAERDVALLEEVLQHHTEEDLLEAVLACARRAVPKTGSPGPVGLAAASLCDACQCMLAVREYLREERFPKAEASSQRFRTRFPRIRGFVLLGTETQLRQNERQFRYLLQTVAALQSETSDEGRELILREASQQFPSEDFYASEPEADTPAGETALAPRISDTREYVSEQHTRAETHMAAIVPALPSLPSLPRQIDRRWLWAAAALAVGIGLFLLRYKIPGHLAPANTPEAALPLGAAPLLLRASTPLGEISLDGKRIASAAGTEFALPTMPSGYHLVFVSQKSGAALIYVNVGARISAHADAMNTNVVLVSQTGVAVSGTNGTPVYLDGNLLGYTKLGEVAWANWREGEHQLRVGDNASALEWRLPAIRQAQIYAFISDVHPEAPAILEAENPPVTTQLPPASPGNAVGSPAPALPATDGGANSNVSAPLPASETMPNVEANAWTSLDKTNLAAVQRFLAAYPGDAHAADASALASELSLRSSQQADEAAWSTVAQSDRKSLDAYLAQFPNGLHATQAREWLAPPAPAITIPSAQEPALSPALNGSPTQIAPSLSDADQEAIFSALNRYANAWSARNINEIIALRPTLDRRTVKDMLSAARSIVMSIHPEAAPVLHGENVTILCVHRVKQVFRDGAEKQVPDVRMTYTLARRGGKWIIAGSR